MEENSLVIYNKGIIGKVKKLFKKLMWERKKNKILLLPEAIQSQRPNINEEIIIPLDQERERIKSLQRKFQKKEIREQDIAIQDIEKLKKLYNTQIRDLKNKIDRDIKETEKYKSEIIEIRLKL